MDQLAELKLSYLIHLAGLKEDAYRQLEALKKFLVEHNCTFKGEPMPLLMKPNFLSQQQTKSIEFGVEYICSALNKFITLYMNDPEVREIMKFSDNENLLFSIDPGYDIPLVISRLDAFLHKESMKFLEFNSDSPAGMAYSDIMEAGFYNLFGEYPFLKNWEINFMNRQELLFEALITCYSEFRTENPSFPEKPVIAIVDWEDISTASEFLILQDFFKTKGLETIIGSPLAFRQSGGKALLDGQEVHLVYRRVITRELLEKWDEVADFVECVKSKLVCCCNSFRSYIVGNKKVLAIITDPRFQNIYSKDELKVIQKTIPWTKIISDTKVSFGNLKINLKEFIIENKNKLVLKPANLYGGKNVYLGPETEQEKWEEVLFEHLDDHSWIVQEYVDIPVDLYPVINDGLNLELKKVNINPFAFLGKYGGSITRISDESVINVSAGGGLVPTLSVGDSLKKGHDP